MSSDNTTPEGGLVSIYLNDHLAGSTAGLELFRRAARANADTEIGAELARLTAEIEEDRAALIAMMAALGVPRRRYKTTLAWLGEKLGRLKLNGRIVSRSPLSPLIEVEALRLGVEGKALGWRVLRTMADDDARLDAGRLEGLIARAREQIDVLDSLHQRAAERVTGQGANPTSISSIRRQYSRKRRLDSELVVMAGHAVFEVAALGTDAAGEADVVELATAIAASAG